MQAKITYLINKLLLIILITAKNSKKDGKEKYFMITYTLQNKVQVKNLSNKNLENC